MSRRLWNIYCNQRCMFWTGTILLKLLIMFPMLLPMLRTTTSLPEETVTTNLFKLEAKQTLLPNVSVHEVNCSALIAGNETELSRAYELQSLFPNVPKPNQHFINETKNCDKFKRHRNYITKPLSVEEENFPLAFSMLIYKDIEQFERLLRAVYHPQNFYCVHVDLKSPVSFKEAAKGIASCFKNVFIASHLSAVKWGKWTVLEPELTCMADLLKFKKWKYFINLTGQEFPLKTNLDIIQILKIYNGANNVQGTIKRRNMKRLRGKGPAPYNITITKGSVHIAATREYVNFAINDARAQEFAKWLKGTRVPDETFFSSLNHSPHLGVPGSYKGIPETDQKWNLFINRFKNWGESPCGGKRVRHICIFGIEDLPVLFKRPELFANKFHLDYQHFALDCVEELHYRRILHQTNGIDDKHLDLEFYKKLDFVHNHV